MKANSVFKKCVVIFLMCVLLLTYAVPAMAKAPITFSEKVTAKNNIILYEIEISTDSNVCGLSFEVKYSQNQVELDNCTVGEILDGGIAKSNTNIGGKVVFTYISMTPLDKAGSVILLEFVPISTGNKNIDIECEITECIDKDCNEITYTYSEREISNPKYVIDKQNQSSNDGDTTSSTGKNQVNTENSNKTEDSKEQPNQLKPSSGDKTETPSNETVGTATNTESTVEGTPESNPKTPIAATDAEKKETTPTNDKTTNESESQKDETIEGNDSELEREKADSPKTCLILLICGSLVILIIFAYAILAKKNLLKRRNRSEKN